MRNLASCLLMLCIVCISCQDSSKESYGDKNVSVPKGNSSFPSLGKYWVIDKVGVLSPETIQTGHEICRDLKAQGIAEIVVLIIEGVKQPEDYATHYGRWLKLGSKGASTEGGNNGIVWLIRPDAKEQITVSVGRGLPRFTSTDYGKIIDDSSDYCNFFNYDQCVLNILRLTRAVLTEPRSSGLGRTP